MTELAVVGPETAEAVEPTAIRTTSAGWLLRALLLEKVVQHALVTWALSADRWGIRDDLAVDFLWLSVIGGFAGFLYGVALFGHLLARRWCLWLAAALAALDIIGEFVAQGTPSIAVTVSFVVAIVMLVLCVRSLPSSFLKAVTPSARRASQ
jgi:hypothetical protein